MLALIIPWALVILLILAILFLIKRKRALFFFFVIAAIWLNWLSKCIPFRLSYPPDRYKGDYIKIISYNIDGTSGNTIEKARNVRALLREYSPDIVFIAEYDDFHPSILDSILKEDFNYTTRTEAKHFQYFFGSIPIYNNRRLQDKEGNDIGVYACSILMNRDTIDLFGCHLSSNNYSPSQDRVSPDSIQDGAGLINYLHNVKSAGERRTIEVESLIQTIEAQNHQTILMGDFNDVSFSQPLNLLEDSGFKDAWWEGGVGYGATVNYPLPYRIDHIMHTNGLVLKTIRVIKSDISDHDALYAELYLKR